MNAPEIDYRAVLADLKRRRDELEDAIVAIEPLAASTGGGGAATSGGRPNELTPDAFFGMNTLDAAVKYLKIVKRPQSAAQIASALEAGGFLTRAANFAANVQTTLRREDDKVGVVVYMPNKTWALAEWYPSRPKKSAADRAAEKGEDAEAGLAVEEPTGSESPPDLDDSVPTEPEQPDRLAQNIA